MKKIIIILAVLAWGAGGRTDRVITGRDREVSPVPDELGDVVQPACLSPRTGRPARRPA